MKTTHIPFVLIATLLIFLTLVVSGLFLSFAHQDTEQATVWLSSYTVRPTVVHPVELYVKNKEPYPLDYSIRVVDSVTGDIANNDGVITYTPLHGTMLEGQSVTTYIIVEPSAENKLYSVQVLSDGKVIARKKLHVIAYG